jgi:cellulose synthase/poly-beta-1,6-N-acetylglucosamine synthase-like glycosyltransferase
MDGLRSFASVETKPAAEPIPGVPSPPFLTVVICTHERPRYLATCLAALAASGAERNTAMDAGAMVLVVDSASSAAAAAEIAALAAEHGARLLRVDNPGLSLARNAGLAAVTTPWVAYIDDDARVAPDWARAIAAAVARLPPSAAALGGPIVPAWEAPCPIWWPAELIPALTVLSWSRPGRVGDGSLPRHVEPYGANMIFRTAALRAIGGFPPQLGRIGAKLLSGEEAWVMRALRRAGHEIHYDPAICVTHSIQAIRLTPRWLLQRQFWSGVSEAIVAARLGNPRDRRNAFIKGVRMSLHASLRAPLALWPQRDAAMIRQRCALAFASGYLRGLMLALQR